MNKPNEFVARALTAARQVACTGELDDESLAAIVAGVIHEGTRSSHRIANILADLTGKYPAACDAVAVMAADPRPHVRRRAMHGLGSQAPHDFSLRILEAGFQDRDPIVADAVRQGAERALGIRYPWSLACCLWGRGTKSPEWATISAYQAQRDPTSAAGFAYVQEMVDGRRPRPDSLVTFLRELRDAGAESLRSLAWLSQTA